MFDEDRSVESIQRELFLWRALVASLVVHGVIMTILFMRGAFVLPPPQEETKPADAQPRSARVFMPRPEELRRLSPAPPKPPVASNRPPTMIPAPPPTPKPAGAKDRISIGPRDTRQVKELWLRRDQEIPKTSKGNDKPEAPAAPRVAAVPTSPPPVSVGTGDAPLVEPPRQASIMGSLQRLQEKWAERGTGLGTGPSGPTDIDGVRFDPQGADFTEWVNHMTREVYRNWLLPEAARLGFRGRVTIRFVIARDGTLVEDVILESSGTRALDVAARDSMRASRLLPLPADFAPPQLEMSIGFSYNMDPHRS